MMLRQDSVNQLQAIYYSSCCNASHLFPQLHKRPASCASTFGDPALLGQRVSRPGLLFNLCAIIFLCMCKYIHAHVLPCVWG